MFFSFFHGLETIIGFQQGLDGLQSPSVILIDRPQDRQPCQERAGDTDDVAGIPTGGVGGETIVEEIAQSPMDQVAGGSRCGTPKIAFFHQEGANAPQSQVAQYSRAGDTPSDNDGVELRGTHGDVDQ
jgi:hypothetical protein